METNPVDNAKSHDGVSSPEVVPAPMGAAAGQTDESFIGPLGPPDATSVPVGCPKGACDAETSREDGNGAVANNAAASAGEQDDDDDDDAMMDDLAEVELHVPLHDIMGSDDDDDDSLRKNGKEAPSGVVTSRAPSLVNGWDDHAVASCFDRAIQMHSMTAEEILAASGGWEAGPNVVPPKRSTTESAEKTASAKQLEQTLSEGAKMEVTTSISDHFGDDRNGDGVQKNPWKPTPLPLPTWAVDPVYAAAETTMS